MEETVIVIMLKNPKTGFLENEIGSYKIIENENLIYNIYGVEEEKIKIYMKVSVNRELEDWEYPAVFDYYDTKVFESIDVAIEEDDSGYDPMWEIEFDFSDDVEEMESKILKILEIHVNELKEVFEAIKPLKEDYID